MIFPLRPRKKSLGLKLIRGMKDYDFLLDIRPWEMQGHRKKEVQ